jgi:hypothetical protein
MCEIETYITEMKNSWLLPNLRIRLHTLVAMMLPGMPRMPTGEAEASAGKSR